jgi:hypothetical protein
MIWAGPCARANRKNCPTNQCQSLSAAGQLGKECPDVLDVGQGPIMFAKVAVQVAGDVTN